MEQFFNHIFEDVISADSSLLLAFNSFHSAWSDTLMLLVSNRFIWIPLYLYLVYLIVRHGSLRSGVLLILCICLATLFTDQIAGSVIKPIVARLRPTNPENPLSDLVCVVQGYRGGRYSFPSCHAANTFMLATFVWLYFRNRWMTAGMFAWAAIVSFSRMYLGVHYPIDILCGAVFGMLSAWLFYCLYCWLMRMRRPPFLNFGPFKTA